MGYAILTSGEQKALMMFKTVHELTPDYLRLLFLATRYVTWETEGVN